MTRRLALPALGLLLAAAAMQPATAHPGSITRVSATRQEPNGPTPPTTVPDTTSPSLSLDGLSVAFASDASNLVAGDTNNAADVFVRDLTTGRVTRASVTRSGRQANGPSYSPALSVDGRYLAFVSQATNLVRGDTNGFADVFVKDLETGRVRRISVSSSGAQANGDSNSPFVSLFGRWITFESSATNLSRNDINGVPDAFVHDRRYRTTVRVPAPRVTRPPSPVPPEAGFSEPEIPMTLWTSSATVSYDGRYVAFLRSASRFSAPAVIGAELPEPPPARRDVFIWERKTNRMIAAPGPSWGGDTCAITGRPVISADGRRVAYESQVMVCRNGVVGPNPLDHKDILVYDIAGKQVGSATINNWYQSANADSYAPSVSADAERIAFVSDATNLVAGDTNGQPDIFVRDSRQRTTSRVSLDAEGRQSDGPSSRPSISYEGRNVVFASSASNLVPGDGNRFSDAFWRDRRTDVTNLAPRMKQPFKGTRRVSMFDEVTLKLSARDRDGDPIRFGSVLPLPPGASLDPVSGVFRWTPSPVSEGNQLFAFFAEDTNGDKAYAVVSYLVRPISDSIACRVDCSER